MLKMIKPLALSLLLISSGSQAQSGMNKIGAFAIATLAMMTTEINQDFQQSVAAWQEAPDIADAEAFEFPNMDPVTILEHALLQTTTEVHNDNVEGVQQPYDEAGFQWLLTYITSSAIHSLTEFSIYLLPWQERRIKELCQNFVDDLKGYLTGDESGVEPLPESEDEPDDDDEPKKPTKPKKVVSHD